MISVKSHNRLNDSILNYAIKYLSFGFEIKLTNITFITATPDRDRQGLLETDSKLVYLKVDQSAVAQGLGTAALTCSWHA
jgi:hypothetical protein